MEMIKDTYEISCKYLWKTAKFSKYHLNENDYIKSVFQVNNFKTTKPNVEKESAYYYNLVLFRTFYTKIYLT